jgi:hypothetical protein
MDMKDQSRRDFLKNASLLVGSIAVAKLLGCSKNDPLKETWRLNPAFRAIEKDGGGLELFTHSGEGKRLSHRFVGLEADLLRMISANQTVMTAVQLLSKRHGIGETDCRAKVTRLLKEYSRSGLIINGEKIKVKVTEVRYG